MRFLFKLVLLIAALGIWRSLIWPNLAHSAQTPTVTISTRQSAASSASASSTKATTATPTESIVQGMALSATYRVHYQANTPAHVKTLFAGAIAAYNRTGIVKLVSGTANSTQNGITLGVYHKSMPQNAGSFELGRGGPQITQRWGATTSTINHATAKLNLTYQSRLSEAVALHELGHALGLAHSSSTDSIMYPVDQGVTQFSGADLAGLKQLYPQGS